MTAGRTLAYGLLGLPLAFAALPIYVHVPRFYAEVTGIDLMIYLAGDYVPMRAGDFDLVAAEKIVSVNFNGAMRLAATFLPDLRAGGGIAFVASVGRFTGS